VWENPNIDSICSAMPNMIIRQANVAAVLNKINLSRDDKQRLKQLAQETAPVNCAGCANICEPTADLTIPISNVLRYSMYNHCCEDRDKASTLFNTLRAEIKVNIIKADYSVAEDYCSPKFQIIKVLKKHKRS
jgi:hypothetical protein